MRFVLLIDALVGALEQELDLLAVLPPERYSEPSAGYFTSSVGQHIRHNLDHIASFFYGLPHRRIDYESRERRPDIEVDPKEAACCIRAYVGHLQAMKSAADIGLEVREEDGSSLENAQWQRSSLARELQFLLGHTVHHNALIAQIVYRLDLPLPKGFGVAPSTERHQSAQAGA